MTYSPELISYVCVNVSPTAVGDSWWAAFLQEP